MNVYAYSYQDISQLIYDGSTISINSTTIIKNGTGIFNAIQDSSLGTSFGWSVVKQ
jgi:hypothetical protein